MIRDKDKIYVELNSPDIVLVPSDLVKNKYVVSGGDRNIKAFNPGAKKIMITDSEGNAASFSYNQPNRLIGTDSNGNLELIPQAPPVPPPNRILLVDTLASGITQLVLPLDPYYWYEVEIIGAGGGGGCGFGRDHALIGQAGDFLDGTKGGDGAYIKKLFKLSMPVNATIMVGSGGVRGRGLGWWSAVGASNVAPVANTFNYGGNGGRTPILPVDTPVEPNDGLNPVYQFDGLLSPNSRLGGIGVNGGANGGDSYVDIGNIGVDPVPSDTQGVGGSGGGANGPYGGKGGTSDYRDNAGVSGSAAGGGGGAGAGLEVGGAGGYHNRPDYSGRSFGGGGGGWGVVIGLDCYHLSSGGGGGGGASVFQWGDNIIICGGGGGGAGAGYGGEKHCTPGEPGISNTEGYTVAENGGFAGTGCNFADIVGTSITKVCNGGNGGIGIIRLWRCE